MLLPLLLAATPLLGYFISSQAPDELAVGKKWFFTGSLLVSLALLLFVPWWLALVALLGFVIGWFAGLLSLALLAAVPVSWELACVVAVLGILLGSRWRAEKRSLKQLILGSIALAIASIVLPQLI